MRKVLVVAGGLLLLLGFVGQVPETSQPVRAAEVMGDFKAHVVGFVQKHCIGCHNDKTKRADLNLAPYTDAASILKDRKIWQHVSDQVHQGVMPPASKARPAAAEVEQFLAVVGHTFAEADRKAKPDPGRVTVRRLNRAEYNNTIRELCGVDFNPAEDFPSDDVGHGFDNIGDVLSLSPVLMERYLAASEVILQRAIPVNPIPMPRREISIQYTEPAGPKVLLKNGWRYIHSAGATAVDTGPIHTPYQVPPDGEYTIRTRVYAETDGKEPVKIVVLAHGTTLPSPATKEETETIIGTPPSPFMVLKTLEIKGRDEKTAEDIRVDVPANLGLKRSAIGLIRPAAGTNVKLYLRYLALDGPKDTRPASQRMLLASKDGTPSEKAREILARFASRAYRRPATTEEVDRLMRLFESSQKQGEKFEAGIVLAMQAVLVSPKFLFRIELDDRPDSAEPHPLNEWQLASRLSYFLWSSMPDEELFELARKGELTRNLDAQVARMLKSPRAAALVDNFALQWLHLRNLKNVSPDQKLFPKFDEPLRNAMLTETELFLKEILREDRSVLDLIDGKFTYLNSKLAGHYGIADTLGNRWGQKPAPAKKGTPIPWDKFVRVELPDDERSGILTMASVLTVTSNPTRTSPVKRGRWVLEQILGTPPPPPPPDVPELDNVKQTVGSLRQRMEQHRENPSCAGCHARMDPLGFAFENYDAVGAWRTKDGNDAIDSSGVLPDGKSFKGPAELKTILREKRDQFTRCLAEKMLTFALGRGLEYYDRRTIDTIVAQVRAKDYRISALVSAIAASDPFRMRRGKGTNP